MLWLLLVCSSKFSNSQSQIQTFHSSRIKIINYGVREQTTTLSPTIITLNLADSAISIQPEHPGINEFLAHQDHFEISGTYGTGKTTRVYFTKGEYIFTFDTKMRAVVLSKRDVSPQVHSVWLEDISTVP